MATWSVECFISGDENIPYEEMIQKYEGEIFATC